MAGLYVGHLWEEVLIETCRLDWMYLFQAYERSSDLLLLFLFYSYLRD